MSVAATSIKANRQGESSGNFGTQREQIFEFMKNYPMGRTRREISEQLGIETGAVGGRVNALIKSGELHEVGQKICSHTGKFVKAVYHKDFAKDAKSRDVESDRLSCEARYWAKQYLGQRIGRTRLEKIVEKRGDRFRDLLNESIKQIRRN